MAPEKKATLIARNGKVEEKLNTAFAVFDKYSEAAKSPPFPHIHLPVFALILNSENDLVVPMA
jgi:hypothetical protein